MVIPGVNNVPILISSWTAIVNYGPQNGTCIVSIDANDIYSLEQCIEIPNLCRVINGTALSDLIEIYCFGWVDANGKYPLQYSFSLYNNVDDSVVNMFDVDSGSNTILSTDEEAASGTLIQTSSTSATAKFMLGTAGYYVVRVNIFDSVGADTQFDVAVC